MAETIFRQFDFSGGVNQKQSSWLIGNNQATAIKNITFKTPGALTKRTGQTKYNSTHIDANPIGGLYRYYKQDGAKITLCASGTCIYKGDDGTGTWTALEKGFQMSAFQNDAFDVLVLTSNLDVNFETWKDLCFITNGTETVMKYDGVLVDNITAAPLGKYVKAHKNRLFIAGVAAYPNRLYFSDLGDETTYPVDNFIDIRTNDGDWITGLAVQGDNLVNFKNNSIYTLYGSDPDDFVLRNLYVSRGAISQRAITNWQNILIFASRDGVYVFDGSIITLISEPIETEYGLLNSSNSGRAAATIYKDCCWLSYPIGSNNYNSKVVVFDLLRKAWTIYDGIKASVFSNWEGPGDNGNLYAGDSTDGFVWRQDSGGLDGASAIATEYITKAYDLGIAEREKTFRRLYLFWQSSEGTIYVEALVDGVTAGQTTIGGSGEDVMIWDDGKWDEGYWGYATERVSRWDLSAAIGYRLALKITTTGLTDTLNFYGFSLLADVKEPR